MSRGDRQFVEFVEANSARLLRAAHLLIGDRHQAEDAVQSALARTYASWSRVRNQDAYAYARRVLTNLTIDRWRRPIKEQVRETFPDHPEARDFTQDHAQQEWLMRVLAQLTARERAIIVLRHYLDLSEAEVAAELKVSLGTVKSTNSRALAKLRTTLSPAGATAGEETR
ncbi:SigE family RNA polymerase sigma factor [Umezawaea sp.]|uniref:SigE family RNA polymerase sigma factor n=1 Tax=Umezawaea sp. TaxID=1955258 RepID=UPI002ED56FEE